ncbi:uncharacterized protein PV07_07777 [Cladophialophora immunda]|uniref:CENP-V/GFA domain-containing protein n=1 Tax=Cladophialophora immunda TaxID=569365 RepID=A0A0D2CAK9_9EURO|nr:uncharacterized protein PV07_07777 [Cladophialophora immunda]KIW28093.1 hypothetical protein PV07_07777 [Cladophialophora immunda]OQV08662.1 hypothetical protein CLAIMM_12894 [Cladophialophora immunda]
MFESSCLCGANRLRWEAEPFLRMRCWCVDCKKFSGSTNTNNILVPLKGMKVVKGNLKTFTLDVESGNQMTSFFCDHCGSTLYRRSSGISDGVAVMVGGVDGDEMLHASKPQVEIYTSSRPEWVAPIKGAEQVEGAWHPRPDQLPKRA